MKNLFLNNIIFENFSRLGWYNYRKFKFWSYSNNLNEILNTNCEILSLKPIYINVLLSCLCSRNLKQSYFLKLVELSSPEIYIDNHISISKSIVTYLRKKSPKTKILIFQFCSFFKDESLEEIDCDVFFAFNEYEAIFAKNFVKGKIIISGSILGNVRVRNHSAKIYDILITSEFRGDNKDYTHHKIFYKIVIDFCKIHNLRIGIAHCSNRLDKENKLNIRDEIDWFSKSLGINDNTVLNSYEKASHSKLIICVNSNFGIDLLTFGYRVFYCTMHPLASFESESGPFWTNQLNRKNILYMLDWLLCFDEASWINYLNENFTYLLSGDKLNEKLHNTI